MAEVYLIDARRLEAARVMQSPDLSRWSGDIRVVVNDESGEEIQITPGSDQTHVTATPVNGNEQPKSFYVRTDQFLPHAKPSN